MSKSKKRVSKARSGKVGHENRAAQSKKGNKPGRQHDTSGPESQKRYQSFVPHVVVVAALSLFLMAKPSIVKVWIEANAPWWLSSVTILAGVTGTWLLARALLIAQLRTMSLGEGFRDDKTVDNLLSIVLTRIATASLWATLMGLISLAYSPIPDELSVTNALGTYITLGVLIGLLLSSGKSYATYRSSLRLMRAGGPAGRLYWRHAQIIITICDALIFLPALSLVVRLASR